MKVKDLLPDVGRPVQYYPSLNRITGSIKATLFLCQFLYWHEKGEFPNGWVYKTREDIWKETGLTFDEQRAARKKLSSMGILTEHYDRYAHKKFFQLNLECLKCIWCDEEALGIFPSGSGGNPQ